MSFPHLAERETAKVSVKQTVIKNTNTAAGATIINQLKRSFKVAASSSRIPIRKEVIKNQLGGINAVPLKLRVRLDKFLNGI